MKKKTIILIVALVVLACLFLGIRAITGQNNPSKEVQEELKGEESIKETITPEPTQPAEEREQPSALPITEETDDNNQEEDEIDSTPSTEEGTIEMTAGTEMEPDLPIEMPGSYIPGENDLEEDVFD